MKIEISSNFTNTSNDKSKLLQKNRNKLNQNNGISSKTNLQVTKNKTVNNK